MIAVTIKRKRIRGIIIFLLFVAAVIITCRIVFNGKEMTVLSDPSQITSFIESNGYIPLSGSLSEEEIIIPSEFNSYYLSYNDIQKLQGFDLTNYKGRSVKKYRCKLDGTPENNTYATLLVYEDKLIGADISVLDESRAMELIKKEK